MNHQRTLIAIIGPTGVGKTAIAIELAERVNGEIVSADSRQIYRGMDIGTGKPTRDQLARVKHHLIDIVNPDQSYTLSEYQTAAVQSIKDIFARKMQPFLVGGTGLYIRAVTEGLVIPEVPPTPEIRSKLEARASIEGGNILYAELAQIDPEAALKIDPRNIRRTIRALEVYQVTGQKFSELGKRNPPPFTVKKIGLTLPREELYRRIDQRIDEMIKRGWLDEVRSLTAKYDWKLPSLSSLGYPQMGMVLRGEISIDDAAQLIKHDTHRFVRHQYAWFRPKDPRIEWFDVANLSTNKIIEAISEKI